MKEKKKERRVKIKENEKNGKLSNNTKKNIYES